MRTAHQKHDQIAMELALLRIQLTDAIKIIEDAPVGVVTNGERINEWLRKRDIYLFATKVKANENDQNPHNAR